MWRGLFWRAASLSLERSPAAPVLSVVTTRVSLRLCGVSNSSVQLADLLKGEKLYSRLILLKAGELFFLLASGVLIEKEMCLRRSGERGGRGKGVGGEDGSVKEEVRCGVGEGKMVDLRSAIFLSIFLVFLAEFLKIILVTLSMACFV